LTVIGYNRRHAVANLTGDVQINVTDSQHR
jgi:hypothetical protein